MGQPRLNNTADDQLRREKFSAAYGPDRNRLHGRHAPNDAVVLIAGDSYTHVDEVGDEDTYPAQFERILDVPTANLGVTGYGPDQALLKLESQAHLYPRAKLAILSILYDDASRMLNSLHPILQYPTGRHFGLKPFIEDGTFREIIGRHPYRSLESFTASARVPFDEDYWRRSTAAFP